MLPINPIGTMNTQDTTETEAITVDAMLYDDAWMDDLKDCTH